MEEIKAIRIIVASLRLREFSVGKKIYNSSDFPIIAMQLLIIIFASMPNKSKKVQFHKDVKRRRIRKSLSERIKRLNRKESHYRTCQDEAIDDSFDPEQQLVKVEPKNKVFSKKGVINFIQSLNSRMKNHVNFLLFGMIYIDEDALNSNNPDRSLLKSMFNFYSINCVKITPTYLIIKIQLNFQNIYPVGYIIERFKSQGKKEFLLLAQILQNLHRMYANFQRMKVPSMYDNQIDKQLLKNEGKPCMLMISPNIIAFSKELIDLSGYSMESMATSCLLNRSFLFDLLLSDSYMDEVMSYLNKFQYNGKLRRGEVSPEEYREGTSYSYQASIIDKGNNKIKLKAKRSHLEIGVAYWEVEKVIGIEKLLEYTSFPQIKERINFETLKKQKGAQQVNNLASRSSTKIIDPKTDQEKVCGYKIIQKTKIQACE